MSLYTTIELINLVRDARNLPATCTPKERAALYALASRVNPARDGQYICWPTLQDIADSTSQSPRSVQRALTNLRDAGLIHTQQRMDDASYYWIDVAKLLTFKPGKSADSSALPASPIPVAIKDAPPDVEEIVAKSVAPPESYFALSAALEDLPHVGAILTVADTGRITKALAHYGQVSRMQAVALLEDQILLRVAKSPDVRDRPGYLAACIEQRIQSAAAELSEKEKQQANSWVQDLTPKVLAGEATNLAYKVPVSHPSLCDYALHSLRASGEVKIGETYLERGDNGELTMVTPVSPVAERLAAA